MTEAGPTDAPPESEEPCPQCGATVDDSWLECASCGAALAAPAELATGEALADGRFVIRSVLGRGGFGITYAVGDERLQRLVAIKELFPESAVRHGSMVLTPPHARLVFRDARTRFLGEARVLARFSHPGIVRVFEVFEEHGTAYLVMELLEGRTLSALLRERRVPLTEPQLLDVAARVGGALRAVHAAGVLHRDLNPSNVVLTDTGRLVLIDFGLARAFEGGTQSFTRMVTPGYAPPEQYAGSGRFGPATDVYGLAATLYRLATLSMPVSAVDRQAGKPLPAPHRLVPTVGKALSDALLDGLELDPGHRPQTIDAFLARLGAPDGVMPGRSLLLDGFPVAAGPDRPIAGVRPPAGVNRPNRPADPPTVVGAARVSPEAGSPNRPADPPTVVGAAPARPAAGAAQGRPSPDAPPAGAATHGGPAPLVHQQGPAPAGVSPTPLPTPRSAAAAPARQLPPPPSPKAPPPPAGENRGDRVGDAGASLRPVGPHRPGRRLVLLPLAVATLAVTSAAPVVIAALLVVVLLPALATAGDVTLHRHRLWHGQAATWFETSSEAVVIPLRFLANVATSLVRAVPALAAGAVALGGWSLLHGAKVAAPVDELALRLSGFIVAGVLLYPLGSGSRRFRTNLGTEAVVEAVTTEGGRLDLRGVILLVLCIAAVAGALWLHPDAFPIHN